MNDACWALMKFVLASYYASLASGIVHGISWVKCDEEVTQVANIEVRPMQTTRVDSETGADRERARAYITHCVEYWLLRNICLSLEIRRLLQHHAHHRHQHHHHHGCHHIITSSIEKCLGFVFAFANVSLQWNIFWRAVSKSETS